MQNRTKEHILNAFNSLLNMHTIEDISINMILKEADISKTTFYRYFKDKYDVMSYNYDVILKESFDSAADLRELLLNIVIQFHKLNERARKNLSAYKGANSTNDYLIDASMHFLEELSKKNRDGKGLSADEHFKTRIIIGGISVTGNDWPIVEDDISSFRFCADSLYDLFPDSIKELKFIN